jgi:hypothetical protein
MLKEFKKVENLQNGFPGNRNCIHLSAMLTFSPNVRFLAVYRNLDELLG